MAEIAPVVEHKAEDTLPITPDRTLKPGTMTAEETRIALERGPYVSRLKAKISIMRALNRMLADDTMNKNVDKQQVEDVRLQLIDATAELLSFDAQEPESIHLEGPEIVLTPVPEPERIPESENVIKPQVGVGHTAELAIESKLSGSGELADTAVVESKNVTVELPLPVETMKVRDTKQKSHRTSRSNQDESTVDRDLVGMYLSEIGRTPLLDADKEVELSKTIEAGLMAQYLLDEGRIGRKKGGAPLCASEEELRWLAEEGQKSVDEFIRSNLRLVVSIARKYGRSQLPMLDLIQEGNTGLIRAVEKFDYKKGYKFSTYATWWVRQAITRGIAQQARIIRLPVHVVEDLNQVAGTKRTLERQLGREPDDEEIAEELGIEVGRVRDLLNWGKEHVSLDAPIDDEGETSLGDLIGDADIDGPSLSMIDSDAREQLIRMVNSLEDRVSGIIMLRHGLIDGRSHKLADIGVRYGISAERVRQLERQALNKLRELGSTALLS